MRSQGVFTIFASARHGPPPDSCELASSVVEGMEGAEVEGRGMDRWWVPAGGRDDMIKVEGDGRGASKRGIAMWWGMERCNHRMMHGGGTMHPWWGGRRCIRGAFQVGNSPATFYDT